MDFNIFLLLPLCALICTQCNFPTANALIGPNVRQADTNEFPFIVSLARRGSSYRANANDHICTGTAISTKHVLTAEQCVLSRLTNETVILHGSNALIFCRAYSIQWWITFNEWYTYRNGPDLFTDNDIAIVKLIIPFLPTFEPTRLTDLLKDQLVNEQVTLAGWGISRRRVVTPNLLTHTLNIISIDECEARIEHLGRRRIGIHDRLFCTYGTPNAVLQNGDTGGPVLHDEKIIGIHKQILPRMGIEFHPGKINIHTSIDFYRDFIAEVTHNTFLWM